MVNIFSYEESYPIYLKLLFNIEAEFDKLNILSKCMTDLQLTNKILRYIDNTEVVDEYYLRDRFDKHIPIYAISTGAKAALLLAFIDSPEDYILDTRECGYNSIQAIILFVKNCNVITNFVSRDNYYAFCNDADIVVRVNGQVFNTTANLDEYVDDME